MPKVKISEYSATANSNTDVASINIDEGCAPSGINNAIRAVMGHLKDFQQGTNGDPFNGPVNGTLGATTASTANVTTLTTSSTVTHNGGTANGVAYLNGSKVLTTGSALVFDGTNVGIGTSSPTAKLTVSGNQSFVEKTAAYLGVDVATSAGNGGNLTVKAGAGNGAGNTAGTLYLGAGRGNASASNGSIVFGIAQATNTVGLDSTLMTLDASGNLGIGTSSPQAILDVSRDAEVLIQARCTGATGAGFLRFKNGGGNYYMGPDSSTGNRGFATGGAAYGLVISAESAYPICFGTNNLERARIDSSGNLLVGTTGLGTIGSSSGSTITASGAIYSASTGESIFSRRSTDGDLLLFRRDTTQVGSISVTTTATAYNTSSDYRLKHDIQPMTGALAKVAQLKPVTYKWKVDGSDGEGFIAHELAEVVPQCVTGEKDAVDANGNPVYQGIDTSFLVATLTAAIQELKAEFDAYKATHP